MSLQPASLGRLWLGPQTALGSAASTYHAFQANLLGLTPQQMAQALGQMVGGNLVSAGRVKTAAWAGGAVVMPPVLDEYIGWLFYAFAGSVSSVDNGNSTYTHTFPQGADSTAVEKYLTGRRSVPGASTLYEQMQDLRVYRLLFGLTAGDFATMRAEFMGRVPTNPDGSGWTFSAKQPEDSTPITCNGHFEVPDGTAIETATGVSLELINVIPDLRRVLVIGDPYPVDFPTMERVARVRFTFLWENKDLYSELYYDTGAWDTQQYSSSFEVNVQSGGKITGSLPYQLTFYAQHMDWEAEPLALRGGDLVEMGMTGTLKRATSGQDWRLQLTNGTESYAWPS